MKKILFVVDEKMMGGVSIVLEDILKCINKTSNKIDLLVLHPQGDRFKNLDGINYIEGSKFYNIIDKRLSDILKSKNLIDIYNKLNLIFLLKTGLIKYKIKKTRKKFLKEVYDVEIAFKDGFCTIFTAHGNSKKKITWLHTDYSNNDPASHYKKTFTNSLNKLDVVVAISKDVKKKFNDVYGFEDKTIIINNYIDSNKVIDKSKQENIKYKDKINFVTVGRLSKVKGYDRLIEAFNKLNKEQLLEGVSLNMIGDGEEFERLNALVNKYSLQEKIIFLGKKENPYSYLKEADMMLMSSLSEAYPLVVIESLILGVPVFTSEYSSVKEMLKHNYDSYIVKNNFNDIYLGLKKIVKNKDLIKTYKKNLNNNKYYNKDIIKQIEELWR